MSDAAIPQVWCRRSGRDVRSRNDSEGADRREDVGLRNPAARSFVPADGQAVWRRLGVKRKTVHQQRVPIRWVFSGGFQRRLSGRSWTAGH